MEGVVSSQREMERVFREWTTRAGWGAVPGAAPAAAARPDPPRREGSEPDAEKLRDEVTTLRERLRSLEDQLKRKDETK
jgi:hypothetical protein